jgi:hypothetical protein
MAVAESEVPIAMTSIWTAPGELAREHGVSRVAEVLGLEFNQLKRTARARSLAWQRGARGQRGFWN